MNKHFPGSDICFTCGGVGEVIHQPDPDSFVETQLCHDCRGRGLKDPHARRDNPKAALALEAAVQAVSHFPIRNDKEDPGAA